MPDEPKRPLSARGKKPSSSTTNTPRGGSAGAAKPSAPKKPGDKLADKPRSTDAFLKSGAGDSKATPRGGGGEPKATPRGTGGSAPAATKLGAASKPAAAAAPAAAPPPPGTRLDVSAEMTTAVLSVEMSSAVAAAAEAAAQAARDYGMPEDEALKIHAAAESAAIAVLDPTGASGLGQSDGEDGMSFKTRIESKLARAVKKNAIRVMDLFKDWDEDKNGIISKKEFRAALRGLDIEGSKEDHDALFDKWDVDGSGALDFEELNKALRKGMRNLRDDPKADADAPLMVLGRAKAAEVKAAREAGKKQMFKVAEKVLSPRSQQLKEAAEREAKQKRAEEEERIRKEEEVGSRARHTPCSNARCAFGARCTAEVGATCARARHRSATSGPPPSGSARAASPRSWRRRCSCHRARRATRRTLPTSRTCSASRWRS